MAQGAQPLRMSFLEYVAFEKTADVKHEYLDGQVWAMAGGTLEHAQLAANMIGELRARLLTTALERDQHSGVGDFSRSLVSRSTETLNVSVAPALVHW